MNNLLILGQFCNRIPITPNQKSTELIMRLISPYLKFGLNPLLYLCSFFYNLNQVINALKIMTINSYSIKMTF